VIDDETRHLTPDDLAQDRDKFAPELLAERKAAGLCCRWGAGFDACVLPYDHAGEDRDAQGNTTLTITAALLGRNR
jgi:hypothetical protein